MLRSKAIKTSPRRALNEVADAGFSSKGLYLDKQFLRNKTAENITLRTTEYYHPQETEEAAVAIAPEELLGWRRCPLQVVKTLATGVTAGHPT